MQTNQDLLQYLLKNIDPNYRLYFKSIFYELGMLLEFYGDHFKLPKDRISLRSKAIFILKTAVLFMINMFLLQKKGMRRDKRIISNATSNWNEHIKQQGYEVSIPLWEISTRARMNIPLKLFLATKKIQFHLTFSSFKYLTNIEFLSLLKNYHKDLKNHYINESYDALIVNQIDSFFENISIHIFKELKKPVIFWHHGGRL